MLVIKRKVFSESMKYEIGDPRNTLVVIDNIISKINSTESNEFIDQLYIDNSNQTKIKYLNLKRIEDDYQNWLAYEREILLMQLYLVGLRK